MSLAPVDVGEGVLGNPQLLAGKRLYDWRRRLVDLGAELRDEAGRQRWRICFAGAEQVDDLLLGRVEGAHDANTTERV